MRPCVAVCLVEQHSRSSARNQLASGALVEESADLSGRAVELDADDAIVERVFVGVYLIESGLGLRLGEHAEYPVAISRQTDAERRAVFVVATVRVLGAHSLIRQVDSALVSDARQRSRQLDDRFDFPRVRVEHRDRSAELFVRPEPPAALALRGRQSLAAQCVDTAQNPRHREVYLALADSHSLAEQVGGVAVRALYRAAAEDIVELVEQQVLPCAAQVLGGVTILAGEPVSHDAERLGGEQLIF